MTVDSAEQPLRARDTPSDRSPGQPGGPRSAIYKSLYRWLFRRPRVPVGCLGVPVPLPRDDDPDRLHRALGDRDPDHRPHRASVAVRAHPGADPRDLGRHVDDRPAPRVPHPTSRRRSRGHPRPLRMQTSTSTSPWDVCRVGREVPRCRREGAEGARRGARAHARAAHRRTRRTSSIVLERPVTPRLGDRKVEIDAVRLWTDDLDGFMTAVRTHIP